MLGDALFLLVMWAVSAFLANRLYVIVRCRAITIRGVTYSKADTPIMYWVQMVLLVCGFTVIGSLTVGVTLYYSGVLE